MVSGLCEPTKVRLSTFRHKKRKKRKNLKQRNKNGPTYHVLSRFTLIHSILHPHLCMRASQCGSGASVSDERVRHLGWILSVSRTTDVTRPTCTRGGAWLKQPIKSRRLPHSSGRLQFCCLFVVNGGFSHQENYSDVIFYHEYYDKT